MKRLYKRYFELRNFYLMMEVDKTNVVLLSKILAISFYNDEQLDELPRGKTLEIDCSDLPVSVSEIENSLSKVLYDLEFKKFDIWHNKNFNLFHTVNFLIKD